MSDIGVQSWHWHGLGFYVNLKGPREFAFFSERYGYRKPMIKLCGWRLFVGRTKA